MRSLTAPDTDRRATSDRAPRVTRLARLLLATTAILPSTLALATPGATAAPAAAAPATVAFPADAGVANAKTMFGAKGDGVTDDTAALVRAFNANDYDAATSADRSAPRTVFLPAGTYLVSDSVIADSSTLRITGAGPGLTTIKLKDRAAGFTSASSPRYVLKTGNALESDLANSGFSNYVQNLTIDVGVGNPGAVGARFDVANTGAMQHVVIRSSDPSGAGRWGLAFQTSPGPAFMQDVTVEGFDIGVYFDSKMTNDLTFQDLRVRNQKVAGIQNDGKNIILEGFVSEGAPVAISTGTAAGTVVAVGATMTGKGTGPAVKVAANGFVYLRDVEATGWSNLVTVGTTASFAGKTAITEWSNRGYRVGSTVRSFSETDGYVSLALPIKRAPELAVTDLSKWANVRAFGATAGLAEGDPANDQDDDGPALQRAIDSGAEVVYFPYGTYSIQTPVQIRGNVKKIDFLHSRVNRGNGGKFAIGNVAGDTVYLENVSTNVVFEHNAADRVVIRNLNPGGGGFTTGPAASGELFIENAGAHAKVTITRPVNVWARSMDRAGADWLNSGGTLWNLTNNIETRFASTSTVNGGRTEIIGGAVDNLGEVYTRTYEGGALFQSTDSFVSVVVPGTLRSTGRFEHLVHDTKGGTTTDLYDDVLTRFTSGGDTRIGLPLYVTPGYQRPQTPPSTTTTTVAPTTTTTVAPTTTTLPPTTTTTAPPAPVDTRAPVTRLTAPAAGTSVKGTVSITATATDEALGSGVARVEFFIDGQKLCIDRTADYAGAWNTTVSGKGDHVVGVRAVDQAGNASAMVTATVRVR